ncbi:2-dehydropantoate 2-reductase [Oricola thermophila]|uniref:2-dehydropantoate 2-reductase n=1 Tax=Oricola thermophila TaxID=2742145 RepID=A0A6N1VFF7_9HYPH|nr:2-dehydropantoate 2-reductase [Oricola thermophila]QKV19690.1 2-dehydropantoate 2-reductase [Oricola thermophila]
MKTGIFGAGSVGCHVGGMLAAAGLDVVLVGRPAMDRRLTQGMLLTCFDGSGRHVPAEDFAFSTEPAALADRDVIFVCVKSAATREAGRELAKAARPDSVIVSLQNGISNAAELEEALAPRTVLRAMVGFNVAQIGGNRFHRGTEGEIVIGDGTQAGAVVDMLATAGIAAKTTSDIEAVQWGKLLLNLNNAVNALSGLPLKRELSMRAYRQVLAASMREALTVLKTAGIRPASVGKTGPALITRVLDLPDWLFVRLAASMLKMDEEATSSMAEDLARGRMPEVDWLNGEIVALGKQVGVATPVNERIVALVKAAFANEGPRSYSGAELKKAAGI